MLVIYSTVTTIILLLILCWGEEILPEILESQPDIILMSDVVYYQEVRKIFSVYVVKDSGG